MHNPRPPMDNARIELPLPLNGLVHISPHLDRIRGHAQLQPRRPQALFFLAFPHSDNTTTTIMTPLLHPLEPGPLLR